MMEHGDWIVAAEKGNFMKTTVLALTTALLLAGGAATTASAQTYYYDNGMTYNAYGDVDRDGVPNRYDTYDNRYDNRYSYGRTYGYDRYGNRIVIRDRDCDGVSDNYDPYSRDLRDADCDGIPNRYDSTYDRYGQRPYGYRHSRWSVGTRLPYGLYGHSHYVDYETYGLREPPYGYRWNQVGRDAYLVSIHDGLIADVIYNMFH